MLLLFLYASIAVVVSFVCSILESVLLSSRQAPLVQRREEGERGAALMLRIKQELLEKAISAILTLNTIANTVGATLVGYQAEKVFPSPIAFSLPVVEFNIPVVGLTSACLTLSVLIFSEIIPKTLGTVYWARLVPPAAYLIRFLTWILLPLVTLSGLLTRLLTRGGESASISRAELAAMVSMAHQEGTLAKSESRVVANVLRHDEIKVEDVMTPRTVISMLPVTATIADFLASEECRTYSRIPLYSERHDNVIGYVLQREALAAAAEGQNRDTPLETYLRKAPYIPEGQAVGSVLRRMIGGREHVGLVTDEYGGISGLVTLEDLVETTLGVEILDESDQVADLRKEAVKLREARLQGLKRWRQSLGIDAEAP